MSIPELGTIHARSKPLVVITSNGTRELSDALRRRCLYQYIDYPDYDKELAIVRAKAPDAPLALADLLADPGCSAAVRLWATTRREQLPPLLEPLQAQPAAAGGAAIALACGPEGGWSEAEEAQAEAAGWLPVQLGPRILRSSTACVAGLSLLSDWRDQRC